MAAPVQIRRPDTRHNTAIKQKILGNRICEICCRLCLGTQEKSGVRPMNPEANS